jgi:hypothetical protein
VADWRKLGIHDSFKKNSKVIKCCVPLPLHTGGFQRLGLGYLWCNRSQVNSCWYMNTTSSTSLFFFFVGKGCREPVQELPQATSALPLISTPTPHHLLNSLNHMDLHCHYLTLCIPAEEGKWQPDWWLWNKKDFLLSDPPTAILALQVVAQSWGMGRLDPTCLGILW